MNFERATLLARIDSTITQRNEAMSKRNADAVAKYIEEREEWMKIKMPLFVEFAHLVFEKEQKSVPVTSEDCSEEIVNWNGKLDFFPRDKPVIQHPMVDKLLALKAALVASTDEIVTSHGLKEIGFKDINQLFTY